MNFKLFFLESEEDHKYNVLYLAGGSVLAWDSLSMSSIPVPALGLCHSGQLAPNVLSLTARHKLLGNILERAKLSPTLDSLNEGSLERELRSVCKVEHLKELKYKQCEDLPAMASEQVFCPVERSKSWMIFDDKRSKIVAKQIKGKKVRTVNLWLRKGFISFSFFFYLKKYKFISKKLSFRFLQGKPRTRDMGLKRLEELLLSTLPNLLSIHISRS